MLEKVSELENSKENLENSLKIANNHRLQPGNSFMNDETKEKFLHVQYYEQIVGLRRVIFLLKESFLYLIHKFSIQHQALAYKFQTRESFLCMKAEELNEYYVKIIEKIDSESKIELEEALKTKKTFENSENGLKDELEKQKKNLNEMKAAYNKLKEDYRMEIHNFKHKLKEKLKLENEKLNEKLEEQCEVNKKLLAEKNKLVCEKNQILVMEVEQKSKMALETQSILEEKDREIKNLQEQLEMLKSIRDQRSKRGK